VYQHCLTLLTRLAPQTSLQDLSLGCFLHVPTYRLELVDAGNGKDIRIEGADQCSYTPSFAMAPMRTADLPSLCKTLPRYLANKLRISPIVEAGKSLDTVQGRVITADGVAMYFKPRHNTREIGVRARALRTFSHRSSQVSRESQSPTATGYRGLR
jgi:hypothetical protein